MVKTDGDLTGGARSRLTVKQCEVLDLLLDHKTSKEIAQVLKISPHTVDQRIRFAKRQLGATTRSDLARMYRLQRDMYNQSIYENSPMPFSGHLPQQIEQDDETLAEGSNSDWVDQSLLNATSQRIVPELLVGRLGRGLRLIAILAIALLAMLLALGGLAIYSSLAEILAR